MKIAEFFFAMVVPIQTLIETNIIQCDFQKSQRKKPYSVPTSSSASSRARIPIHSRSAYGFEKEEKEELSLADDDDSLEDVASDASNF